MVMVLRAGYSFIGDEGTKVPAKVSEIGWPKRGATPGVAGSTVLASHQRIEVTNVR